MSWRTVSRIAAASAIAILMLTCLPVTDSCAHEAKEASNAVYFATSSPLSPDDIDRLYDDRTGFAEFAMGALGMDATVLTPSDIQLSDLSIESCNFDRVRGTDRNTGTATSMEADISFRSEGTGQIFALMDEDLIDLYECLNNNRIAAGDYLEISGHLTVRTSWGADSSFERNQDGDFVRTHRYEASASDLRMDDATLRFHHGTEVIELSIDSRMREICNVESKYDFGGTDPEKADAGTSVYIHQRFSDCYSLASLDCSGAAKGSYEEEWDSADYSDYHRTELEDIYGPAVILHSDLEPIPLPFGVLFPNPGDPSLNDEDSLKAYLSAIGRISDSYSDAEDLYDDVSSTPTINSTRRLMVIGSIGVLLSVAALAILFYFSRKK